MKKSLQKSLKILIFSTCKTLKNDCVLSVKNDRKQYSHFEKTGLQTGLHTKKVQKSNWLKIKNPNKNWGFKSSETGS
jgi:hypothetical protein